MYGKNNIAFGFLVLGLFMGYGFLLVYLRDFSVGREEWIASYAQGDHFLSRSAHVHGSLFAVLNIIMGYLLLHYRHHLRNVKAISILAILGLFMPAGMLAEMYFDVTPLLTWLGAMAMLLSVLWCGFSFLNMKLVERPNNHHRKEKSE